MPIRTIPIILGAAASVEAQASYKQHWMEAHRQLSMAVADLDRRHCAYLDAELNLLARAPELIGGFLSQVRELDLPAGEWWLSWNCRYLVGTILTTFRPDDHDATNWTFSNPRVAGAPEATPPLAPPWTPGSCHLLGHSTSLRSAPPRLPGDLAVTSTADERHPPQARTGVHVVLLHDAFLSSLPLCQELVDLHRRAELDPEIRLVPVFLDDQLTKPAGEVALLRQWTSRLRSPSCSRHERAEIDALLTRLGPVIVGLRDLLVPLVDH